MVVNASLKLECKEGPFVSHELEWDLELSK